MASRNPLHEIVNSYSIHSLLTKQQFSFAKECKHNNREDRSSIYSNCIDCGVFLTASIPAIRDIESFKVTTSISDTFKDMAKHQSINRKHSPRIACIKSRSEIIDWICGIGDTLKQSFTTVHKAISYFDTSLTNFNITSEAQLKLHALTCLQIASKYNELDKKIPRIKTLLQAANYEYTSNEIKSTEKHILNELNWILECVTPIDFIDFFLAQGIGFVDDKIISGSSHKPINKKIADSLRKFCEFFADLCAQDYSFNKYSSIIVAAAIIASSRKALKFQKIWCDHLVGLTGKEFKNIKPCFEQMYSQYYQISPNCKITMDASYAKHNTLDSLKKETPVIKMKELGTGSSRYMNDSKMGSSDKETRDSSSMKKNSFKIKVDNPISIKTNLFTTTFKAYLNTSRNTRYELEHKQSHSVNPLGRRTAIKLC